MSVCKPCICFDCIRSAVGDCKHDLCHKRCWQKNPTQFVPNPAIECRDYQKIEWAIKARCLKSDVLKFNDGSVLCPLTWDEDMGCKWCYELFEKENE